MNGINVITNEREIGVRRGGLISEINVIECYHRTKSLMDKMDIQIQELTESVGAKDGKSFRTPREEMMHLHDVKTLTVVKRQRERLAEKLKELQRQIQTNIELAK